MMVALLPPVKNKTTELDTAVSKGSEPVAADHSELLLSSILTH